MSSYAGLGIERSDAYPPLLQVNVADEVEEFLAAGQKLRIVMMRLSSFSIHLGYRRGSTARGWNALQSRHSIAK